MKKFLELQVKGRGVAGLRINDNSIVFITIGKDNALDFGRMARKNLSDEEAMSRVKPIIESRFGRSHAEVMIGAGIDDKVTIAATIGADLSHDDNLMSPTPQPPDEIAQKMQELIARVIPRPTLDRVLSSREHGDLAIMQSLSWLSRGNTELRQQALIDLPLTVHHASRMLEYPYLMEEPDSFNERYANMHKVHSSSVSRMRHIEDVVAKSGINMGELYLDAVKLSRPYLGIVSIRSSAERGLDTCLSTAVQILGVQHFEHLTNNREKLTELVATGRVIHALLNQTKPLIHAPAIRRHFAQAESGKLMQACGEYLTWSRENAKFVPDWINTTSQLIDAGARFEQMMAELDMERAERIVNDALAERSVSREDAIWLRLQMRDEAYAKSIATPLKGVHPIATELLGSLSLKSIAIGLAKQKANPLPADRPKARISLIPSWQPLLGELRMGPNEEVGLHAVEQTSQGDLANFGGISRKRPDAWAEEITAPNRGRLSVVFAIEDADPEQSDTQQPMALAEMMGLPNREGGMSWWVNEIRDGVMGSTDADIQELAEQLRLALEAVPANVLEDYLHGLSEARITLKKEIEAGIQRDGVNLWSRGAGEEIQMRLNAILPGALGEMDLDGYAEIGARVRYQVLPKSPERDDYGMTP